MRQPIKLDSMNGTADAACPSAGLALTTARADLEAAKAEIKRLKLALSQACDEIQELTEVTSEFVRLKL
jgi:hypothetical protein